MDYNLSDEHLSFQRLFRTFAQREVAPRAAEIDREEHLPRALLARAAEQGLLATAIPESEGGAALDMVAYCLMLEELGQVCLSTALALAIHSSLAAATVVEAASEAQRAAWLPALAAGDVLGAFAASEPDAGSDVSSMQTRAVREGDMYRLDGVKSWVSNAESAGLFVVIVCTQPGRGHHGLSALLVPRDTPGLQVAEREPTLGLRGLGIHTLYFDGCRVPADHLLGAEGDGRALMQRAFGRVRLALAAAGLGAAEGALALGRQFAVERKQFGVSIATKQAIGNYFADTRLEIESLRHLVLHAAWMADQGHAYELDASMAKLLAAQVARNAANRMLQVHGGYGFSDEYAISRVYRDVRALALMGGTDQIQRVLIAQDVFAGTGVEVVP